MTVKAVKTASDPVIDDDFAKNLGLTDLAQLRGLLRGQLEQETAGQTRTQMKRALLDQLAAGHDFEVPVGDGRGRICADLAAVDRRKPKNEDDPAAALAEIEAEKADYHAPSRCAGCGWGCCYPRSARPMASRLPNRKCRCW